jgi:hypothetical protein
MAPSLRVHRLIIIGLIILLCSSAGYASTYLDLESDSYIYTILSRLEAEGVIRSGLLSMKPISRKQAFQLLNEAEQNSENRGAFVQSLVASLRDRLGEGRDGKTIIKPVDSVYATYVYNTAESHVLTYGSAAEQEQTLNYNNNGDIYDRGSNVRLGVTSRIDDLGPFSFYLNPEYRHPDQANQEENNTILKKGYGVISFGLDVIVGRDSQWWGPGYHGALLLSNNAEPFTMIKLTNPSPITLPWIFKYLGPFGFTFFVTNLEKDRPVAEPHLYGIRLAFKPSQYIEIGLEKTAILCGEGRPCDWKTWFDSLTGQSHGGQDYNSPTYTNIDDQRAGLDIKITIPWHVQPLQIYGEADGEDVSARAPVPQSYAFLGGLYLPRVLGAERFDLRLEYATTQGRSSDPYVWYTHGDYTSYTYKGNIIGHHTGTDSNDFFTEVSYLIPEKNGRVFLSYDQEEHNLAIPGDHEKLYEVIGGLKTSLSKRLDLTAQYGYGKIKNRGNIAQETMTEQLIEAEVRLRF